MKKQEGKFLLFDMADFAAWLNSVRVNRVVKLVQNHHTWSPAYKDFNGTNHFAQLKGMERSHLERGFSEIAQNLTTFPDGTVAACRSLDTIPAGIKGANAQGVCIEHLGNFDTGGDAMTPAHKDSILKVNALLCRKFGLTPNTDTIVYHHWYDLTTGQRTNGTGDTKTCPGTNFFGGNSVSAAQSNFIPLVQSELARLTAAAPAPASPSAPLYNARVVADALNVRSQPAASGKLVKQLKAGIFVSVYKERDGWCRIHPTDSHWVNGRYLEKVSGAAA